MTRTPRTAAAGLAFAATAALVAGTVGAAHAAPATAGGDGANGYKTVGYYPAWDAGNEDGYQVADLQRTGAASDLTHLNYAFGNVTTDLVCDITDREDPVDGGLEGDPLNDYVQLKPAGQAVDGVADTADQALAGNFNQLKKLKEANPGLKVLISLGGWTWSDNFSDAVSTPENRERLVESCLDVYFRGNLPVVQDSENGTKGGDGVAAGIFDGVDLDWEWPGATGEHPTPRPEEDAENFVQFAQLLRAELDELGTETGEDYLITGFAPAGWAPRTYGGWLDPRFVDALDFINVQGYDYHGDWNTTRTGHQGNLHVYDDPTTGEPANWGLAADGVLGAYHAAGWPKEKLVLGMAAYGYGWKNVTDPTPGAAADGALPFTYYSEIKAKGLPEYYDEVAGQGYFYGDGEWWTADTPRSVTAKAEYLAVNGYGGGYFWDLAGDLDNELLGTLRGTFETATPGPLVPADAAAPWYASGVYATGDVVYHDGVEYRAAWWTRNQEPGQPNGPWRAIGGPGTAPAGAAPACGDAWDAGRTYTAGDVVTRAGVNYTAQWWTTGSQPGTDVHGAWDAGSPCA
ncbi:glycosyl hydrolase family 18 protein [Cellulosimicrobium cellulans]|uniref:glycosyl hydrolase family 18 protein n=1 Tax=Cellulosimicrobium cellulans TaxID=1710 RepID=UPI002097A8AC|nr:glycosyl hydrolase family 18 protein [Cellulosimicrobium cellulans]MCO7273353.1 glycosyl hydrolase family 18 protein [Cellulosimicrobium cellulans]